MSCLETSMGIQASRDIRSEKMLGEKGWARHSNPWSGWTRVLTFPLLYVPIWGHDWKIGLVVIAWFAVNPFLFPPPKDVNTWMSKGVMGEKIWMETGRKGLPLLLNVLMLSAFIGSIYTAWNRLLWPTMFFAVIVFIGKLWFLDRMVTIYEER